MRIQPLEQPKPRPEKAAKLLAPERELDDGIEFDPRRDISPKDWEAMKGELETSRGKDWPEFGYRAHHLVLLFPDRRAELNLNDEVFDGMKEELETYRGKNWRPFGFRARELVLLFPDRRAELNLDSKAFSGMKGELAKLRGSDWLGFSAGAIDLAILAAQDARITSDGRIQITPKKRKLSKAPPPLPERARV